MPVTEAAVRQIIATSLKDLSMQMATAEQFLAAAFAATDPPVAPPAEPLYSTLGTWAAAHLVAITDPRLDAARRAQYGNDYQDSGRGTGWNYTAWGQMLCVLDPTGVLARSDPTACMAQCADGGKMHGTDDTPTPAVITFL